MKKVFFKDSEGNKVAGILSDPTNNKENLIVLLVHGLASNKESRTYVALEKALNKMRLSTLRIDMFGHGESEGLFDNLTPSKAIGSINVGLNFLKNSGYENIGIIGSSFGGMCSLIATSKFSDIKFLILQSPIVSYKERGEVRSKTELKDWKERGYALLPYEGHPDIKLNYAFYEDSLHYDGYRIGQNLKIPVFILHGRKDDTVLVEQSEKLARYIKDSELKILDDADHYFRDEKTFKERLDAVMNFVEKFLERNS